MSLFWQYLICCNASEHHCYKFVSLNGFVVRFTILPFVIVHENISLIKDKPLKLLCEEIFPFHSVNDIKTSYLEHLYVKTE